MIFFYNQGRLYRVKLLGMDKWENRIIQHRFFLLFAVVYVVIYLINLTLLPIFNDESIYLDWGWSHTHTPGHLYDALLDAKQPLMIWIFGIFENFFDDPLFAGRFASVLIGLTTAFGIYTLAKKLFNKQTAIVAILLYAIIPIFTFYNRQALLEAAVACCGIWSSIALLNIIRHPSTKNSIILGTILGIGFFVKSSILLFIVSASLVIGFYIWRERNVDLVKSYFISLATFVCVDFLLFINPIFWQTFSSNSRYAFTLAEIFTFPFNTWGNNLSGFFEIGFIFITPLIFLASIWGVYKMKKDTIKYGQIIFAYFISALLLEVLSAKSQSQRYIVPFLPFLVIPASYFLSSLWKGNIVNKSVVVVSFIIPLVLSLTIIFNPEYYITQVFKVSKYSEVAYIRGQTSGHGINEVMRYIKEHASLSQPTLVVFGFNIGNPESAVDLYSQKSPNVIALHIDSKIFEGIDQYPCMTSKYPVFFVTRNDETLGLDRYFSLEKSFVNPEKTYSVNIYTLKKNCRGNTFVLSDIYQGSINKVIEIKSGY